MGMGEESSPGCCEIICRLVLSFIYNCYPHLKRPRSWCSKVSWKVHKLVDSSCAHSMTPGIGIEKGIYIGMIKGEVTINSMEQNKETCM